MKHDSIRRLVVTIAICCGCLTTTAAVDTRLVSRRTLQSVVEPMQELANRQGQSITTLQLQYARLEASHNAVDASLAALVTALTNMTAVISAVPSIADYPDTSTALAESTLALNRAWEALMRQQRLEYEEWRVQMSNAVAVVYANMWHHPTDLVWPTKNRLFQHLQSLPAGECVAAADIDASYQSILIIDVAQAATLAYPAGLEVVSEDSANLTPGRWIVALTGVGPQKLWVQMRLVETLTL